MKPLLRKLLQRFAPVLVALALVATVVAYTLVARRDLADPIELPIVGDGVSLSRLAKDTVAPGSAAHGQSDDWILETRGVRVVVGADAPGAERALRHGTILDIARLDMTEDVLVGLAPALEIQGAAVGVVPKRVAPAINGKRPVLVLTHESTDRSLSLETTLSLRQGSSALELVTRVKNVSKKTQRAVAVGDAGSWPGAMTFAPRLGFVEGPTRARVPWIARRGATLSLALSYPEGADVEFRFDRIGPTEQRALTRATDLAPGAYFEVKRTLHVTRGGLAAAARAAWHSADRATRTVRGKLLPVPDWATVEARHPDGKVVLSVRAERDGRYALPLPPGSYELLLRAPGGEDTANLQLEQGKTPVDVKLIAPEPGQLRFSVVDEAQRPLPARWTVSGIPPTQTPSFGPAERAEGAGRAGYTLTGEGRVQLPPGKYSIVFSQGPERALWESLIDVSQEKGATVRAELPRKVETPGWIAGDFHLHAAPSHDSSISLEDRVVSLIASGIEVAVPTDHNHTTDYAPSVATLGAKSRIFSMPGVEMTTQTFGHFNAYPYPKEQVLPKLGDLSPNGLFSKLRELAPGALIQVNHPRMGGIGYFNAGKLDPNVAEFARDGFSLDFDVIEVVNGFELGQPEVMERNLLEWFSLLSAGRRYTAVGNSDSHWLSREFVGYPRTYLRVSSDDPTAVTPEEVVAALRAGRAFVTNGPFLDVTLGDAGPGDLAKATEGRVTLSVKVRAPAWVDVTRAEAWVNGVRAGVAPAIPDAKGDLRLVWQTDFELERDSWIVVVVHGEHNLDVVLPKVGAKPFAFTNPIWIDADGDGSYDAGIDAGDGGAEAGSSEAGAGETRTSDATDANASPTPGEVDAGADR